MLLLLRLWNPLKFQHVDCTLGALKGSTLLLLKPWILTAMKHQEAGTHKAFKQSLFKCFFHHDCKITKHMKWNDSLVGMQGNQRKGTGSPISKGTEKLSSTCHSSWECKYQNIPDFSRISLFPEILHWPLGIRWTHVLKDIVSMRTDQMALSEGITFCWRMVLKGPAMAFASRTSPLLMIRRPQFGSSQCLSLSPIHK